MSYVILGTLLFILLLLSALYYVGYVKILDTSIGLQFDFFNLRLFLIGYHLAAIGVYLIVIPIALFIKQYTALEVGSIMLIGLACLNAGLRGVRYVENDKLQLEECRKVGEVHRHQNKRTIRSYYRIIGIITAMPIIAYVFLWYQQNLGAYIIIAITVILGLFLYQNALQHVIYQVKKDEQDIRTYIDEHKPPTEK